MTRPSKQTCIAYSSTIIKLSCWQYFVWRSSFPCLYTINMIVTDHWRTALITRQPPVNRAEIQPVCVFTIHMQLFYSVQFGSGMAMDTLSWTACLWQKCWQCGHVFVRFCENLSQGSSLCGQDISIGELSIWHYCIAGSGKHLKWFVEFFLVFTLSEKDVM